jgi:hypothetical protein
MLSTSTGPISKCTLSCLHVHVAVYLQAHGLCIHVHGLVSMYVHMAIDTCAEFAMGQCEEFGYALWASAQNH